MEMVTGNGWLHKVYTTSSQEYTLGRMPKVGEVREMDDGRKFKFIHTKVAITPGQVVSAPLCGAEITSACAATALAGAESITITLAGATVNQFAGGQIVFTESSGAKVAYGIVKNTAANAANIMTVYLDTYLAGAVAATDDVILVPSKVKNCILGTNASNPIGVAIATSTVSVDNWMWVQISGIASVLVDTVTSISVGNMVMVADTAGSIDVWAGIIPPIGVCVAYAVVDTTNCTAVDLWLNR